LNLVLLIRDRLERHASQAIDTRVMEVQSKLDSIIDVVVQKYQILPLDQYQLFPPREVLDKFSAVATENQKYADAVEQITKTIVERLRQEMQKARDQFEDREKRLRICRAALKSFPEKLQNYYSENCEHVKRQS